MDLTTVTCLRAARTDADLVLAPGETVMAGGTWLFSEPQRGVTGLVDLTTMGWPDHEKTETGVSIGATCTIERLATLADDVLGTATADGATRRSADVAEVVAGSPADAAGLEAGDQVTAIDGEAVAGAESLTAQVREHAPGEEVLLTVVRDGDVVEVAAVLGQREE